MGDRFENIRGMEYEAAAREYCDLTHPGFWDTLIANCHAGEHALSYYVEDRAELTPREWVDGLRKDYADWLSGQRW